MTDNDRDMIKLTLLMNAINFIVYNKSPVNSRLQIRRKDIEMCIALDGSSLKFLGSLLSFYLHSDNQNDLSHTKEYKDAEKKLLSNEHFRDFLSAVADGYVLDGDNVMRERLKAAGAYILGSAGKTEALNELRIDLTSKRPANPSASLSGSGCMLLLILIISGSFLIIHTLTRFI